MTAQPARDVGENAVAVLEFDREGGARKHLFDRPEYLERGLFIGRIGMADRFGRLGAPSASYCKLTLYTVMRDP
jgi:hypothetical protein